MCSPPAHLPVIPGVNTSNVPRLGRRPFFSARTLGRRVFDSLMAEKNSRPNNLSQCQGDPAPVTYIPYVNLGGFESIDSSGYMFGITGYKPDDDIHAPLDPDAPWQGRKWRKRALGGFLQVINAVECDGSGCSDGTRNTYSGEYTFDGDPAQMDYYSGCSFVFNSSYDVTAISGPARSTGDTGCPSIDNTFKTTGSFTLESATFTVCPDEICTGVGSAAIHSGSATESLTDEVEAFTVFEESTDPDKIYGTDNKSFNLVLTYATPEEEGSIYMSGRSSKAFYEIGGAPPFTVIYVVCHCIITDMFGVVTGTQDFPFTATTDSSGIFNGSFVIPMPPFGFIYVFSYFSVSLTP